MAINAAHAAGDLPALDRLAKGRIGIGRVAVDDVADDFVKLVGPDTGPEGGGACQLSA
jgi:hypothetical protein